MTDDRRHRVSGGTYFFTVLPADRSSDLLIQESDLLRSLVRMAGERRPFHIDPWVPPALRLDAPLGGAASSLWQEIETAFAKGVPVLEGVAVFDASAACGIRDVSCGLNWRHGRPSREGRMRVTDSASLTHPTDQRAAGNVFYFFNQLK